jgi:hypothetical protein
MLRCSFRLCGRIRGNDGKLREDVTSAEEQPNRDVGPPPRRTASRDLNPRPPIKSMEETSKKTPHCVGQGTTTLGGWRLEVGHMRPPVATSFEDVGGGA